MRLRFRFAQVCLALVLTSALAASAHAATLSITTDKPVYAPGETVQLTVVGNSGGASAYGLFGQIVYDPVGLLSPTAITLTPQSSATPWIAGVRGCPSPVGAGTCWLINYIAFDASDPFGMGNMDPVEQTLATVSATAGAPGLYSVEWSGAESFGLALDFFGLTTGPGASLVIVNTSFQVTPEPSTAFLLGTGFIALGVARRAARRS